MSKGMQGYRAEYGTMDEMTDFTSLANPHFDLNSVGARHNHKPVTTQVSLSSIPLREMLVIQPPLGKAERLPRTLKLAPNELSIRFTEHERCVRVPKLGFYIPERHVIVLDLIASELADPDYSSTHGTSLTYRQGCKGPLCRRARRDAQNETSQLRLVRMGLKPTVSSRTARYSQLKLSVPQYAAIEPLLFAWTVYTHQTNRPVLPTQESTPYIQLDTPLKLYRFLHLTYRPDVPEYVNATITGVSGTQSKTPESPKP